MPTRAQATADLSQHAIDVMVEAALACGALQRIDTEQLDLEDGGIRFLVRWISSLARRDQADKVANTKVANTKVAKTEMADTGCHTPHSAHSDSSRADFNPFLPPEPALTLGAMGKHHLVILNKYPVIARHLLIVTRTFEDQHSPLTLLDFDVLATVIHTLGGLGFYNGGTTAGASQRHKHLQWIAATPTGPSLARFSAGLPANSAPVTAHCHPALPWRHAFIRNDGSGWSGEQLYAAFIAACSRLDIRPTANQMPPYNLLVDPEWMLVVPRNRERHLDISVNALGFAGSLFVRRPEQIDQVRQIGPLQLLAEVAVRN